MSANVGGPTDDRRIARRFVAVAAVAAISFAAKYCSRRSMYEVQVSCECINSDREPCLAITQPTSSPICTMLYYTNAACSVLQLAPNSSYAQSHTRTTEDKVDAHDNT